MYKPKQEGITCEAFMADITAYKKSIAAATGNNTFMKNYGTDNTERVS